MADEHLPDIPGDERDILASFVEAHNRQDIGIAVHLFFELFAKRICAVARRRGVDISGCDDVLQETAMAVCVSSEKLRVDNVIGFVMGVARHKACDDMRSRNPRKFSNLHINPENVVAPVASANCSMDEADLCEMRAFLQRHFCVLSKRERQIIVVEQHRYRGQTQSEVATRMGTTLNAYKKELSTAKKKLQQIASDRQTDK